MIRTVCGRLLGMLLVLVQAGGVAAQGQDKAQTQAQQKPFRFFVSGHSLTDDPLAGYVGAIAMSKNFDVDWDEQIVIGSPINVRTFGLQGGNRQTWPGYSDGKGRNGKPSGDVRKKFAAKSAAGKPFNALILAEGHHSLMKITWNDTVRYARHYRDQLVANNRDAAMFLYNPWEGIKDLRQPQEWIAIEKQNATIWSCVADRINLSLELERQPDRVTSLPVGLGLADLLQQTIDGKVPGVAAASPEAAVRAIFSDDVHLKPLGIYYAALLTFVGSTNQSADGAWKPDFVSPELAAYLQKSAWAFYSGWRAQTKPLSMPECRAAIVKFCPAFNAYSSERLDGCVEHFSSEKVGSGDDGGNPFAFDPALDGKYWFDAR